MSATLAIIIAAISFSFYPLLNSIAMEFMPKYFLALMVQIITTLLSFFLLTFHMKSFKKTLQIIRLFWKLPWDLKIIPLLSGTGIFMGALFFIFALDLMNKTGATLIMECWPFLAIVITRALLTHKDWEPFKILDAILMILAFMGLMLITVSESGQNINDFFANPLGILNADEPSELLGVLLAVLAALCFAWAGVSRSYFSSQLPTKFRLHFFSKKDSLSESNFTYMLTYMFGLPTAFAIYFLFSVEPPRLTLTVLPVLILLGASLVATAIFYSYALLVTKNANINILWYIAPVLATVWLILLGYSTLTPLILIGGALIICANLILVLINKEKRVVQNEHTNTP